MTIYYIYKKGEYFCKQIKGLLKNFKFNVNFSGEPLMPYIFFNEKDENLNSCSVEIILDSIFWEQLFYLNNGYENIASGTDSLEDMKTIEEIWRNELIRIGAE